jgi:hypothetical protein
MRHSAIRHDHGLLNLIHNAAEACTKDQPGYRFALQAFFYRIGRFSHVVPELDHCASFNSRRKLAGILHGDYN